MFGDHVEMLRILTRTHEFGAESEIRHLDDQYKAWTLIDIPLSSPDPFQVCDDIIHEDES